MTTVVGRARNAHAIIWENEETIAAAASTFTFTLSFERSLARSRARFSELEGPLQGEGGGPRCRITPKV